MGSQILPSELKDQGQTLFSLLGSFWGQFYQGFNDVEDLMRGDQQNCLQTLNDLRELVASVSRFQIPIFHCQRWYPLTLQQSQCVLTALTYVAEDQLGPVSSNLLSTATYVYPIPTALQRSAVAMDVPTNPTIIWTGGVDYFINPATATISFNQNPFAAGFQTTPIYGEGNVITDQTITLWFNCAEIDQQLIATQFGCVLQLMLPSSQNYLNLLNAAWDANLIGSTRADLDNALAALCDSPIVQNDGEVVQYLVTEIDRQLVITDQNVYPSTLAATALVTVGQSLLAGQPLYNAFQVIELNQGTPSPAILPQLTLPVDYLQGTYSGGLTFVNENVPLVVTYPSGRTEVTFSLGGATSDVNQFWATVQANGTAVGATSLARLLDLRKPQPGTDPDASSLPTYINPLQFLIQNILRYGMTLVILNQGSFGPNALSTVDPQTFLRFFVAAPQGAILVVNS